MKDKIVLEVTSPSVIKLEFDENNLENSAKAIDNINEMKFTHYRADKSFTEDSVGGFNIELHKKDYAESDLIGNEIVDIYSYYDKDPLSDSDYNGLNAEDGEASGAHQPHLCQRQQRAGQDRGRERPEDRGGAVLYQRKSGPGAVGG